MDASGCLCDKETTPYMWRMSTNSTGTRMLPNCVYLKRALGGLAFQCLACNLEARPGFWCHVSQRASFSALAWLWQHARPHKRDRRERCTRTGISSKRHLDVSDARKQDVAADDVVRQDRDCLTR